MKNPRIIVLEGMVRTLISMRENVAPKTSQNREYQMYCVAISAIRYCIKAQHIHTPIPKFAKKG